MRYETTYDDIRNSLDTGDDGYARHRYQSKSDARSGI